MRNSGKAPTMIVWVISLVLFIVTKAAALKKLHVLGQCSRLRASR